MVWGCWLRITLFATFAFGVWSTPGALWLSDMPVNLLGTVSAQSGKSHCLHERVDAPAVGGQIEVSA